VPSGQHIDNGAVRDDRDRSHDVRLAGAATAAMRTQVIWGPFRFRPGIAGAYQQGRRSGVVRLEATDVTRLAVDPTVRPDWYEGADGERRRREEYEEAECEAPEHEPWRLPAEVPWSGEAVVTGPAIEGP
jgi:hypothetical protein